MSMSFARFLMPFQFPFSCKTFGAWSIGIKTYFSALQSSSLIRDRAVAAIFNSSPAITEWILAVGVE